MRLKHPKGHPLCMPAAAAAVPVAGGLGTTLPSIDIARTLAKKTIDAAITGMSQQIFIQNLRNVQLQARILQTSPLALLDHTAKPPTLPIPFSPRIIWRQNHILKMRPMPRPQTRRHRRRG